MVKKIKTLVLIDSLFEQYELDGKEKNNILFLPMLKYNGSNRITRTLRKIHLSTPLPFKEIWFNNWYKKISLYDEVILADAGNTANVARYIHKKWPKLRIIIWFRNSVESTTPISGYDTSYCEIWSFDKKDCNKYNLKYNPQFYIRSNEYFDEEVLWDAYYLGQDKGRLKILNKIQEELNKNKLTSKFLIVGVNSKRISYKENIANLSHTRVIVDCVSDWQNGLTLRPLESLFYNKKLITNDLSIREMDFYNPNNIFIWGIDNPEDLEKWIKLAYIKPSEDIKYKYTLDGWVARFNLNEF